MAVADHKANVAYTQLVKQTRLWSKSIFHVIVRLYTDSHLCLLKRSVGLHDHLKYGRAKCVGGKLLSTTHLFLSRPHIPPSSMTVAALQGNGGAGTI
jgi:hypothetical protein